MMKLTSLEVRQALAFSEEPGKRYGEAVFSGESGKVVLILTEKDIAQLEVILAQKLSEVKKEII